MSKKKSRKSASGKAPRTKRAEGEGAPASAAAPAAAAAPSAARAASQTDISARAHAIWIARGRPSPGTPLEDWLQAERELRR